MHYVKKIMIKILHILTLEIRYHKQEAQSHFKISEEIIENQIKNHLMNVKS